MKVYLASRFSRAEELRGYAAELAINGIDVTSRWLDGARWLLVRWSKQRIVASHS